MDLINKVNYSLYLNVIRINFVNYAQEKHVSYNKEIVKKYHIIKHLNCLLNYVNTHVVSNFECA